MILSASWPLQQRRQGQPRHGHCRPSGGSDCDISVLEAQDRCCLTGQPMAQQSFGAFGPMKVWDLSGLWEREIQTRREKCTFPLQCRQEKWMREQTTTKVKDNMAFPCLHWETFHLWFFVTLELRDNPLTFTFTVKLRLLIFTFYIYIWHIYLCCGSHPEWLTTSRLSRQCFLSIHKKSLCHAWT